MIINYNDVISRYRKHTFAALGIMLCVVLLHYVFSSLVERNKTQAFELHYLATHQVNLAKEINLTAVAILNSAPASEFTNTLASQLQPQLLHFAQAHEKLAIAASQMNADAIYFEGTPSLDKAVKAQLHSAEQIAIGLLVSERDIDVVSNDDINKNYHTQLEAAAEYFEQQLNTELAQTEQIRLIILSVLLAAVFCQYLICLKPFERVLNTVYKQLKKAWHDADKTNQIKTEFLHNLNIKLKAQTLAVQTNIQTAIAKNGDAALETYLNEALDSADMLEQQTLHSIDSSEITLVHSEFNPQTFNLFDAIKTSLVKAKKLYQQKYSFRLTIADNAVAYFDKSLLNKIIVQLIELFPGHIEQVEASLCANRQFTLTAFGKINSGASMQYQGEQFMQQTILHQQLVSFDGQFSVTQQQEQLMMTCELPLECDALVLENLVSETPAQILLVISNPLLQHVAVTMLEHMGHTVTLAATGENALAFVSSQDTQLIVSDAQLHDMSCVTLTKLVRSKYHLQLPICLLIDNNSNAIRLDALDAGANRFISKPLNYKNVFEQLEKQLHKMHEKSGH